MLFYAACTFATDDAFVDGVITVSINVNNLSIFQMHLDATAASTHVTGGGFNLVPRLGREIDVVVNGHDDVILAGQNS